MLREWEFGEQAEGFAIRKIYGLYADTATTGIQLQRIVTRA